jgi:carboxypeptidase PM20D1
MGRSHILIRSIRVLGLAAALAVVLVLTRTLLVTPSPIAGSRADPANLADAVLQRLSGALQIPTVSPVDGTADADAFLRLHAYLERAFPAVHAITQRETVNDLSLLYTWQGSEPALEPVMISAHLDVVAATAEGWDYPPFAGRIAGEHVWGRGAMDDKAAVLGILEAAEQLAAAGFHPQRTLYLAFGHDEEVGGHGGAAAIANVLSQRLRRIEFVLDEGLLITDGILPGLELPVALIGTAGKGYLDLELVVEGEGGHSSMPPRETAVGVLARALDRLQRDPFPPRLTAPVRSMFNALAAHLPLGQRLAVANLWVFEPLVLAGLAESPATDALIRTTTAPTWIRGGTQANVLPRSARATVNLRILPEESVASTLDRVRKVIADERVEVRPRPATAVEPSAVSSTSTWGYEALKETIEQVFGDVVVAPSLVVPATDSRHYANLARDIYRFRPIVVSNDDLARFHGVNERIAISDYKRSIQFYERLIANSSQQIVRSQINDL